MKILTNSGRVVFDDKKNNESMYIDDIAFNYIKANPIGYGEYIDTFEVLNSIGMKKDDYTDDPALYMDYFKLARKLGDAFVKALCYLGYKADKRVKSKKFGYDANHLSGNIVYTNYPDSVFSFSMSTLKSSINLMNDPGDKGVDLSLWEEYDPEQVEMWRMLTKERICQGSLMSEWYSKEYMAKELKMKLSLDEDFENRVTEFKGRMTKAHKELIDAK